MRRLMAIDDIPVAQLYWLIFYDPQLRRHNLCNTLIKPRPNFNYINKSGQIREEKNLNTIVCLSPPPSRPKKLLRYILHHRWVRLSSQWICEFNYDDFFSFTIFSSAQFFHSKKSPSIFFSSRKNKNKKNGMA